MANQTTTKTPDRYYKPGSGWSDNNVYNAVLNANGAEYDAYNEGYALGGVSVSACSITVSLHATEIEAGTNIAILCTARGYYSSQMWTASQTFSWNGAQDVAHNFSFSNLGSDRVDLLSFEFSVVSAGKATVAHPTVTYTWTPPTLGLSVSPSSLYVGETIRCTISEPFGQTFGVFFSYNSTTLQNFSTSSDSFTQTANESWFSTAGVTGSSMQVTVSIADNLGRSASARVTVNKHTALVPSITAPRGGSHEGGQEIAFVWSSSGDGYQTKAELQWSQNNVNWNTLTTVNGSGTNWTAGGGTFPAGTIYWRLRLTNNHGLTSGWVSQSFTAAYTGASVTLTAPTSGSKDGGQQIAFAWTIAAGSGTVNGTQMEYTSDDGITWTSLVNSSGSVTSYNAPAGKFPAGAIKWRVRAKDSFAGWGDWKQATITITYTPAVVTLTTPTSGSRNGAEAINFAWTITAGSGSVTGTQMQVSSDDGITWADVINSNSRVTSYSSAIAQFPAGTLKWRVRAKDSYSGYTDNWKQAQITVTYAAVSQAVAVNSPTSGVYNAAVAGVFSVRLDASGPVPSPFQIQAASFFWRAGETGEFTEISMTPSGNTASVSITAGTFPSGLIEWYASATDTTGHASETQHYTITALQTAVEAAPLSPVNTIESGSGPITFRWTYGSLDGAPQGRAQLQYSRDGETWTDDHIFADITGRQTNYTAPAGTFPGGAIFWRVRSYNATGTAGPWSAAVSFSSYSAPLVTGVTGDGKPFATITWQADGQEAYEIEVGGKTYGPYYGADVRSFTLSEPLADGDYTVRVRAQNRMSLWSEWISGEMSVVNVPGSHSVPIGADDGESVLVSLLFSKVAPVIVKQPQDIQTTDPNLQSYFRVEIAEHRFQTFKWAIDFLMPWSDEWSLGDEMTVAMDSTGLNIVFLAEDVTAAIDGMKVRTRIWSDVGEVISREATFTYAEPTKRTSPLITGYFPSETGYFLIYRDGKLIGKTYDDKFLDRTALGTHEYWAYQVLEGGYYTRSTPYPVTGTASVTCPAIAPLEGGGFLSLKLSENSDREVRITEAREVEWTQYAGADYPSAEIGEGKSKAVALDVSALMSDEDFARAFTALLGQDVIVKTPDGTVVIGPLESLDLRAPRSHRSWTFGVTQMEWRDFIDES